MSSLSAGQHDLYGYIQYSNQATAGSTHYLKEKNSSPYQTRTMPIHTTNSSHRNYQHLESTIELSDGVSQTPDLSLLLT